MIGQPDTTYRKKDLPHPLWGRPMERPLIEVVTGIPLAESPKDFRPDLREVALRPSPEVEKQMAKDRERLNALQASAESDDWGFGFWASILAIALMTAVFALASYANHSRRAAAEQKHAAYNACAIDNLRRQYMATQLHQKIILHNCARVKS